MSPVCRVCEGEVGSIYVELRIPGMLPIKCSSVLLAEQEFFKSGATFGNIVDIYECSKCGYRDEVRESYVDMLGVRVGKSS